MQHFISLLFNTVDRAVRHPTLLDSLVFKLVFKKIFPRSGKLTGAAGRIADCLSYAENSRKSTLTSWKNRENSFEAS